MYSRKIEHTRGPRNKNDRAIKKSDGGVAVCIEEVKKIRKENTEKLFDATREVFVLEVTGEGVHIQESEVEAAMKPMKERKAIGEDRVAVEIVQALEEWGCDVLVQLANKTCDTGQIPTPM